MARHHTTLHDKTQRPFPSTNPPHARAPRAACLHLGGGGQRFPSEKGHDAQRETYEGIPGWRTRKPHADSTGCGQKQLVVPGCDGGKDCAQVDRGERLRPVQRGEKTVSGSGFLRLRRGFRTFMCPKSSHRPPRHHLPPLSTSTRHLPPVTPRRICTCLLCFPIRTLPGASSAAHRIRFRKSAPP
jgi:hypothetical protein